MKKKRTGRIAIVALTFLLLTSAITELIYNKVNTATQNLLYTNVNEIPYRKTGLLLGTSPTLKSKAENPYFAYRIEATAALYHAGKIKNILISGDNSRATYDEPTAMKEALVKLGVPDSVIFLDFAGFRTIDSIIRAKEIFGRDSVTIISQPFHNTRAIYIANHYGLSAIGYNASDISGKAGMKVKIRERGARLKLFFDLYLWDYSPHFLGNKEIMP